MGSPETCQTLCERCLGVGSFFDPLTGRRRMENCLECGGTGYAPATPPAPAASIDKRASGLYGKFRVERTDGKSAPGQKHDGCRYFVLDVTHDPLAPPALLAYATAAREAGYGPLADDLCAMVSATADDEVTEFLRRAVPGTTREEAMKELGIATGASAVTRAERDVVEALPTRGDVGRPEATRDPVFLLRWRPKKVGPHRERWHVEGVWFTRQEAERFAEAHAYRWGSDRYGPCWQVYCVPADGELARLLKAVTKRDAALRGKE